MAHGQLQLLSQSAPLGSAQAPGIDRAISAEWQVLARLVEVRARHDPDGVFTGVSTSRLDSTDTDG